MKPEYIANFEKLGLGLFIHFGLYSTVGKGEWYLKCSPNPDAEKYAGLPDRIKVDSHWAEKLVRTAKELGAKYITITTRHHDGFSLYDTKNLSDFDTVKTGLHRDLIKEFTDACRAGGIMPVFYHTLLDWHKQEYRNDFGRYIDYLIASVKILCTEYGKVGGFWFDGYWDKPDADWRFDELYKTIRTYQPDAMIINNTGLSHTGQVTHYEIDSVTFERGNPCYVDQSDKERAGEMCQTLNDHWGYCRQDYDYKTIPSLIDDLITCRYFNCNMLLNTGLKGNGLVNALDREILKRIGSFIRINDDFIYRVKGAGYKDEKCMLLQDDEYYYCYVRNVPMAADPNVQTESDSMRVTLPESVVIRNAKWLDCGKRCSSVSDNRHSFSIDPYSYGTSYRARILKFPKK